MQDRKSNSDDYQCLMVNPEQRSFAIEPMLPEHWQQVKEIYAKGIATNNATFETEVPSLEVWDDNHHLHSRLVAIENGSVLGWASLNPTSKRHVYRGIAEVTIYVDPGRFRKGIGESLLRALIASSEAHGIWTLTASIFPENKASIALHEKCGFRILGTRERVGKHHGVWRDTIIMERRSAVVGVD